MRRRALLLVLVAALAALSAGSLATPQRAGAISWTYRCWNQLYNNTQHNIHLLTWIPWPGLPNDPASGTPAPAVLAYIATGSPAGAYGLLLENIGYLVSGGCAGTLSWGNALNCAYSNFPSTDSTMNCYGIGYQIIWKYDVADPTWIITVVNTARLKAAPLIPYRKPALPRATHPQAVRYGLQRGDLTGKGWTKTQNTKKLGALGQLMQRGETPNSCADPGKKNVDPQYVGASLFVRNGGAQSAFSLVDVFRNGRGPARAWNNGLTTHSIRCLTTLLGVEKDAYNVRASAKKLLLVLPARTRAYRVTLRGKIKGRPWTGYLDVFEIANKNKWAIAGYFQKGAPTPLAAEQKGLGAIARRFGA